MTPLEDIQDVYALSDADAMRYIDQYMPPCANCGCAQQYDPDGQYDTPQNWLAMLRVTRHTQPKVYAWWLQLHSLCDKCLKDRVDKTRAQRRAAAVAKLKADTYGTLMPEIAGVHTLAHSSQMRMAMHPDIWKAAQQWHEKQENVWIRGEPGTGKTFLARCIAGVMLDRGRTVAELSGPTLCDIGVRYNASTMLAPYVRPSLLILDDIDKGNWENRVYHALFSLLEKRHEYGKRLVITANVTGRWWVQNSKTKCTDNPSLPEAILQRMCPNRDQRLMLAWELTGKVEVGT